MFYIVCYQCKVEARKQLEVDKAAPHVMATTRPMPRLVVIGCRANLGELPLSRLWVTASTGTPFSLESSASPLSICISYLRSLSSPTYHPRYDLTLGEEDRIFDYTAFDHDNGTSKIIAAVLLQRFAACQLR